MCPLRFILVFLSAIVGGYVAWRSLRSSSEADAILDDSTPEEMSEKRQEHLHFRRIVANSFWVFVDMASGKFLWRNLKEMKEESKLNRR